jgi:hypothetical protein
MALRPYKIADTFSTFKKLLIFETKYGMIFLASPKSKLGERYVYNRSFYLVRRDMRNYRHCIYIFEKAKNL